MSNDDALGTALWLAAGGAAGYAAGRWLVAPALVARTIAPTAPTTSSSNSPTSAAPTKPAPTNSTTPATPTKPRALAYGSSGPAMPIDPYAGSYDPVAPTMHGPSGVMQPIDPYADAPIVSVMTGPSVSSPSTTPPITVAPSAPGSIVGPITSPLQLSTSATTTPASSAPRSATGPIMHPSQTDVRPASYPTSVAPTMTAPTGMHATSARVRRFDPLYSRYRGSIPIEYVRALVERESNGQPSVRTGSAIGLLQIVPVVLADYNKRHGTAYVSEHLTDPATNLAIGCELLQIIVTSYAKNHPQIRTMQPNWDNPEYVGLVTLGWNAGYSEAGGLGRVARYLEGLGAVDITVEQASAHAKLAGATKHLANPAKVAWCKSVVALYQRERALRLASPSASSPLV